MPSVGIVGGGPGGLALAHELASVGYRVTVFETEADLGGLARSFQLGDVRIERYYHFICAGDTGYFRKLRELGIEDTLHWKPCSMGFLYAGRLYPFNSPLDLLRLDAIGIDGRLRYGLFVLYCSFIKNWRSLDKVSAERWLVALLGRATYEATWHPLLKVKFGDHHHQISAAWVWHRVHRVARSRKTPLHRERLGHLEGGTDTLISALAAESERLDVTLLPGQPVKTVLIEGERAVGLQTINGKRWPFDYVVTTVPLPILLDMAPRLPADYASQLAVIDYIGVICLTLRLRHPLTGNFWLNINDRRVPSNGYIEYTRLNTTMTPDGSAILYVPQYLPRSHEHFHLSDERLLQEHLKGLTVVNRQFSADWIIDYAVSRDPFAQVICPTGFAHSIPSHETPIRNLYLLESSQLYPSDRTISGTIDLARRVALIIAQDETSERAT